MRQIKTSGGKVMTVLHGTCMRCGRVLSDQASRRRGYGPECLRKMAGHEQIVLTWPELDGEAETDAQPKPI